MRRLQKPGHRSGSGNCVETGGAIFAKHGPYLEPDGVCSWFGNALFEHRLNRLRLPQVPRIGFSGTQSLGRFRGAFQRLIGRRSLECGSADEFETKRYAPLKLQTRLRRSLLLPARLNCSIDQLKESRGLSVRRNHGRHSARWDQCLLVIRQ